MSRLWILPVCLTLAGCGGGGGSSVSTWLKSEPAPADKTSQQLAQLGASDIPELPRIQLAANTSTPGVTAPQRAGNQSLPAIDMSKSWSTSVEAAPLDDLPPLPTSGSAPTVSSPVVTVPTVEAADTPSVKDTPVLPSVSTAGTGSLPGLPAVNVTATAPKAAHPPKAVVFPEETATVMSSSASVSDPYADRTAAYLITQKTTPSTTSSVKLATLPGLTPAAPQAVATASVGSVQLETLPGVSPAIVKETEPKALARQEEKSPATPATSGNGKRYLVFASFNEAEKAKNLARRHSKLGATVLASEVGGAQVYRVAVPVGKSATNKRRDLAAVGLTDAWPLRM